MANNYFGREYRDLNDWLNDPRRSATLTRKNMEYLGEFKDLEAELKRISMLTYFLMAKCGIYGVRAMHESAKKQCGFIRKVIVDLKKYGVAKEDEKAFDRDIKKIRNRVEYVYPIIKENVRLTEYYPYFSERGFDRLLDYTLLRGVIDEKEQERLYEDVQDWNERHLEKVREYAEQIRPEVEKIAERKRQIHEKEMLERKTLRDARKAADAEVKEIRENERKRRQRQAKIERSFERYYR